jgi:hypothetical protein
MFDIEAIVSEESTRVAGWSQDDLNIEESGWWDSKY